MASVLVAEMRPAATLVIVRSPPTTPTLTVEVGVAPAKPMYVVPPMVAELVPTTAAVVEPKPRATPPALVADEFGPRATEFAPLAVAW
jgi:hypothetical protein